MSSPKHRPGLSPRGSLALAPVLLLAATLAAAPRSVAAPEETGAFARLFEQCQQIEGAIDRLLCYDGLTPPAATPIQAAPAAEAAAPVPEIDLERRETDIARLAWLSRREERGMLTADDPNYFVYADPVDDELGDERHAEFFLSLKYPLLDDWFSAWQQRFKAWDDAPGRLLNGLTPDRLLVHYSGLYDFYATDSARYDSAPIVSRRQNPGISLEYDFAHGEDTLRLGWFHESNGQTLEQEDLARFDQLRADSGADYALARVSRGWDYAMLRWANNSLQYEDPLESSWFNYQIEMRFYCDCQGFGFIDGREDEIWWEVGNDARIGDYDGLRGRIEGPLWRSADGSIHLDSRLDLQTGLAHSTGEHWTGRLTLGATWNNLRMTLFYFDGYGRDPSTYHLRTQYAGLGLEMR